MGEKNKQSKEPEKRRAKNLKGKAQGKKIKKSD